MTLHKLKPAEFNTAYCGTNFCARKEPFRKDRHITQGELLLQHLPPSHPYNMFPNVSRPFKREISKKVITN